MRYPVEISLGVTPGVVVVMGVEELQQHIGEVTYVCSSVRPHVSNSYDAFVS
jgi:hypothetical protein